MSHTPIETVVLVREDGREEEVVLFATLDPHPDIEVVVDGIRAYVRREDGRYHAARTRSAFCPASESKALAKVRATGGR